MPGLNGIGIFNSRDDGNNFATHRVTQMHGSTIVPYQQGAPLQ
jgi:hypothetical protein